MVLLSSLQKGRKTLAVDYNFQYGSGELVKTTFDAAAFRAIAEKRPDVDVSKLGTANTDWQKQFIENRFY
jgi:iron complex outermembrane receptor protein